MNKQFYFLSPVEVVKVTSQNLEEVAAWCGGSVQETESRRVPGRMDKYVLVPTPKDTNISWAFPGMFITKRLVVTVKDELRSTYAVFRRDYFEKNYFDTPKEATDKTWERELLERTKPKKTEVVVNVNVGQALVEAQEKIKRLEQELHKDETIVEACQPLIDEEIAKAEVKGNEAIPIDKLIVDETIDIDVTSGEELAKAVDEFTKTDIPADASL